MLFIVIVFVSLVLTTPTPPIFPEQFTSTFEGVDHHGRAYTGTFYFDYTNQLCRQDSLTGTNQFTYLDIYSTRKDYNYCAWIPSCVEYILVPPLRRYEVPSDSQYLGKSTIRGLECDHWKYSWSHGSLKETDDFYVYFNETGGFYHPLRNVYWWSTSGTTKVDWISFNPSQPDPKLFEVPTSWDCNENKNKNLNKNEKSFSVQRKFGVIDEDTCPPTN